MKTGLLLLAVCLVVAGAAATPSILQRRERRAERDAVLSDLGALRGREACADSVRRLVRADSGSPDDSASVDLRDISPTFGGDLGDNMRSFAFYANDKPYFCLAEYQADREWHVVKMD